MSTRRHSAESSSREVAARLLAEWLETGLFPDRLMASVRADRAFVMELVYGVVRGFRALDFLAGCMLPSPPEPRVRAALLAGLYQLFFLTEVEAYAAVNETVEAVKKLASPKEASLVNAVLRRAQREEPSLRERLARQPAGVRLSHPDFLVRRWSKRFGQERALRLCEWNNSRPKTVIRMKASVREVLLKALAGAGVAVEPHPSRPEQCLVIPHGFRVEELPGYREGWFVVQDPSTLLAPEALNPRPGEAVLDACAAPGGKALYLAELMEDCGFLAAADVHEDRLARLRENVQRSGWTCLHVLQADATFEESLRSALQKGGGPEQFDAILLDVPCSNTGVLRRRVDARWRVSAERLKLLLSNQRAMLSSAGALLKPGGRMVYSTCSLETEENEEQVAAWMREHPSFELVESRQMVPGEDQADGAFLALIRRKEPS